MKCVLHPGRQPLAAADQTIQVWLRWALLLCALLIFSSFGGATQANAFTSGVQITSACSPTGPDSLTCDDQTPFAVRWTDAASVNGIGSQGTLGCFFVYSEGNNLLEAVGQPCTASTWPYYQSSTFPPLQVGVHHITVNRGFIAGDFPASSCCQTVEVVVTRAPRATYTTVTSGNNPSSVHSATFSAKVGDFDQTKYPYSGTVTYQVDGQTWCTTGVAPDGSAGDCLATPLSTGTHKVTATFSGDPNHLGSSSSDIGQVIAPPPASIAATAGTPQQTPIGTAFGATLQVQVKDSSGQPVPNWTVTFSGPGSGPTAFVDTITPVTDNNGYAAVTATANGTVGAYVLRAGVAGVAQTASFALTNQLPPNIISFAKPANTPFSGQPPKLGATATSGLPIAYTSSTLGVCNTDHVNQYGAFVISFVAAGTCTILANQAGDDIYPAATQVSQSFNVTAGSNVISFSKPANAVFKENPPVLSGTASSNLPVTYASSTPGVCMVTGAGVISFVSPGICTIQADQAGNSNYAVATQVRQSFAIAKAAQVVAITSPAPVNATVTGAPSNVTATGGASTSPVILSIDTSSGTGVCSISGSTVSFAKAGTCIVDANQAGDTNYNAAPQVQQSFAVAKAAQVVAITSTAPVDATFAGTPYNVTATGGASTRPVVLSIDAASGAGVCSISGSTVSFTGAGICIVDANQAADANYNAAPQVQQSFAVAKAAQVVAITSPAPLNATVTGTPYIVTATGGASTSPVLLSIDATSGVGVCAISGSTVSFTGAGTCIVDANQAGDANYKPAAQVQQKFAVSRIVTNVTLTSNAPAAVFGAPVTFTATVGIGKSPTGTVTFKDGTIAIATVTLSGAAGTFTTKTLATGSHAIVATYNGDRVNEVSSSSPLTVVVKARPNPAFNAGVSGLIAAQTAAANRFGQSQISNTLNRLDELHDEDGAECELEDKDCLTAGKKPTLSPTLGHAPDGKPSSVIDANAADSTSSGSVSSNASSSTTSNAQDSTKQSNGIGSPGSIGLLSYAPPVRDPISGPGHALLTIASAVPMAVKALDNTNTLPFHIWTAGSINFGSANADGTYNNHFTTSGLTIGADRKFFEGFKAGIALGLGLDHTAVGTDGTKSDARSYSASLYGSYRLMPKTFLDAVLGFGRMNFNLKRWSGDGTIMLNAKRAGQEFFGSLRLTQDIKINSWKFSPYARLDVIKISLAAYTESGSDIWALNYAKLNSTTVSAVIGTRITYSMPTTWGTLTPFLHFEYDHALSGKYSQSLSYTDLPGTNYLISGTAQATDLFSSGLGLRAKTENGLDIDLEYLLSSTPKQIQTQTIRASIKQAF